MSLDMIGVSQLEPYNDEEEEIQLMDTDSTTLHLEEESFVSIPDVIRKEKHDETTDDQIEEKDEVPSLQVIEKLKVYIRDGPKKHHVETIPVDEKYYELPTLDELTSVDLTEEKIKDICESLNLTQEDFRTSSSVSGTSRPESLYIRGVTNMSTGEIFDCFEEFQPIGIEWISDHSCNIFWRNTLTPIQLLSMKSAPGPCISPRRPVDFDSAVRSKRKASSLTSTDRENDSVDIALPPGHWREGDFQLSNKLKLSIKLYLRYTTLDDRKVIGAENQSEYYRQYGNPNYNNMTGIISRSKKRALNAVKSNRFRDFVVVKSNDATLTSSSVVEELPTASEESTTADAKVKFTVVLPPKKTSPSKVDDHDDEEDNHRSKRQRRQSWNDDEVVDDRHRKGKTHFTVTMDSASKHRKNSKDKFDEPSKSNRDNDDGDESKPVTDARQILERKRQQRK